MKSRATAARSAAAPPMRTSTRGSLRRRATCCGWAIRTTAWTRSSPPCRTCCRRATRFRCRPTGRRTAFANWLASPENPLTARVMVNRIWQFRMGDGLVRTPNDFGTMGDKPDSQRAARLAGRGVHGAGWSVKAMDRLIVTVERVPAVVGARRGEGEHRSAEPAVLADEPQASGRRDDPRRGARGGRHAQSADSAAARCAFRSSRKSTT